MFHLGPNIMANICDKFEGVQTMCNFIPGSVPASKSKQQPLSTHDHLWTNLISTPWSTIVKSTWPLNTHLHQGQISKSLYQNDFLPTTLLFVGLHPQKVHTLVTRLVVTCSAQTPDHNTKKSPHGSLVICTNNRTLKLIIFACFFTHDNSRELSAPKNSFASCTIAQLRESTCIVEAFHLEHRTSIVARWGCYKGQVGMLSPSPISTPACSLPHIVRTSLAPACVLPDILVSEQSSPLALARKQTPSPAMCLRTAPLHKSAPIHFTPMEFVGTLHIERSRSGASFALGHFLKGFQVVKAFLSYARRHTKTHCCTHHWLTLLALYHPDLAPQAAPYATCKYMQSPATAATTLSRL